MAYKQVLIAVDLTDEAEEVMTAARNVTGDSGAKVHLLTVIRPLARIYGGLDMAPMAANALTFEEEAIKQAEKQLTALGGVFDVGQQDTHVRVGSPAAEIKAFADEHSVDLIVMGTHGRHGLGLLLGSTANAVLHGVPCDVLAVKVQQMEVS
ncbi:MAG: universal stress protein [Pseudomonadota bacterium]